MLVSWHPFVTYCFLKLFQHVPVASNIVLWLTLYRTGHIQWDEKCRCVIWAITVLTAVCPVLNSWKSGLSLCVLFQYLTIYWCFITSCKSWNVYMCCMPPVMVNPIKTVHHKRDHNKHVFYKVTSPAHSNVPAVFLFSGDITRTVFRSIFSCNEKQGKEKWFDRNTINYFWSSLSMLSTEHFLLWSEREGGNR